jgi:methyl coenzyme M reductase subunit D
MIGYTLADGVMPFGKAIQMLRWSGPGRGTHTNHPARRKTMEPT